MLYSKEVVSPRGNAVTMWCREDTTDLSTVGATFELWGLLHDEYGLAGIHPRTFIDIGGHIGTVTVAVLLDNPDCRAVIVEPLPENIDMIRRNLVSAGVIDRATILEAGIGTGQTVRVGYTLARIENAEDVHRFVGSPVADDYTGEAISAVTFSLGDLILMLGGCDLLKLDCEGCEWTALSDPAIATVGRIVGEWHGRSEASVHELLDATHIVETVPHDHGGTGLFSAVLR